MALFTLSVNVHAPNQRIWLYFLDSGKISRQQSSSPYHLHIRAFDKVREDAWNARLWVIQPLLEVIEWNKCGKMC